MSLPLILHEILHFAALYFNFMYVAYLSIIVAPLYAPYLAHSNFSPVFSRLNKLLAMEGHLRDINCLMYPPGNSWYLRYILLLNDPNELCIQNLVEIVLS